MPSTVKKFLPGGGGRMNERIEIDTLLEPSDFRRTLWAYKWKRVLGVSVFITIVTFLIFFAVAGWTPNISGVLGGFVGGLLTAYFLTWLQTNNVVIERKPRQVTFDQIGIRCVTDGIVKDMKWDEFVRVSESRKDFIFVSPKRLLLPVPKRFFENENQIEKVRSLLRKYLGDKAKLIGG
jgi:hypothetical protein